MQSTQRYVSNELTHFVGRGLKTDEERYFLLVKILKSGWLTPGPVQDPQERHRTLITTPGAKFSAEEMFNPHVVCFCDIPVGDLSIHMEKYKHFGLAFTKGFLIKKEARPVFYMTQVVAKEFDALSDRYGRLFSSANLGRLIRERKLTTEEYGLFEQLRVYLDFNVLSLCKPFDERRTSDVDPQNFYMEREWRVFGNVHFDVTDVYRIIIPQEYSAQFRQDMVEYCGQLTYSDS